MKKLCINDNWRMAKGSLNLDNYDILDALSETEGIYDVSIPVDVRIPLIEDGVIRDPVLADYCHESEWVADYAWWFHREFDASKLDDDASIWELVIQSIDSHADIYLNGKHIGNHINCHYPFTRDIKQIAKPGTNVISVRITSGLEKISQNDLDILHYAGKPETNNGRTDRGDHRRSFVRRPQYSIGWDWGPKCVTIGMSKNAFIRCPKKAAIVSHNLTTTLDANTATVKVMVEVELYDILATADAGLEACLKLNNETKASFKLDDVLLRSGINYLEGEFKLDSPCLWWPSGMGDQPLYDVELSLNCGGSVHHLEPFKYGIRTIKIDMSRQCENNRNFKIYVNDVEMFCKGGDWIPADSIYQRVTKEKYDTLILEAKDAGFNMLRIWGGGIYESDHFYNACDLNGILVWHDFMFACSCYPDHLEWYRRETELEMDYQTKRLRSRTCIALFCGNNENHWLSEHWPIELIHEKQYGLYNANYAAPRIIKANCPQIPYWNSSPYGGDEPNSDFVGNTHHWRQCMMNPEMAKRIEPKEFDKTTGRFVSEYGYPGPCPKESIEDYFDGAPIDRTSNIWHLHNNTFEKDTVIAGIEKHYLDNASSLSLDDYILYAGMVQSLILNYSLESFRFKDYCGGGLFWMYNDTWGEVGWTIIDYYLRRKISYYGVMRAFSPVRFILREVDNMAEVVAANDTGEEFALSVNVGYLSFDGKQDYTKKEALVLSPRSRKKVLSVPLDGLDLKSGTIVVMKENGPSAWLRMNDIRNMNLCDGTVDVISKRNEGDDLILELRSSVFLHGVHFKEDLKASDNYFDLLPGECKTLRIYGAKGMDVTFYTVK